MAREQAAAKAAGRRRRLQIVFGTVLGVALLIGVGIAVAGSLGGGGEGDPAAVDAADLPKLPVQQIGDYREAAAAAGCELTNPALEGGTHEEKEFKGSDYKTNPPTSGNHNPQWYEDGVYQADGIPRLGEVVHTLEHGRINVQYRPDLTAEKVAQLNAFVQENQGYHMLLYPNQTKMPYAVAATAWTHGLTCEQMNDKTFDALRAFRDRYLDKGPERVP